MIGGVPSSLAEVMNRRGVELIRERLLCRLERGSGRRRNARSEAHRHCDGLKAALAAVPRRRTDDYL
jgi:hypothetical protein